MSVLALLLSGPLQSWGSAHQLGSERRTERFPTKSGVVGLLAAALGRGRQTPIDDLASLSFAVRVDRPGKIIRDFHTVSSIFDRDGNFDPASGRLPVAAKDGQRPAGEGVTSNRYYIADARFVAGFEGSQEFLAELDEALRRPVFMLYLGRRSCPPDQPVHLGVHEGGLVDVLSRLPWKGGSSRPGIGDTVRCELVVEDPSGEHTLFDQARSFDPVFRSYGRRRVAHAFADVPVEGGEPSVDGHDPMSLLEEGVV